MYAFDAINGRKEEGGTKLEENIWKFFPPRKKFPSPTLHFLFSRNGGRGIKKRPCSTDERLYGVVIFLLFFLLPPPSSPPRGNEACRWVLTDTGHVLATSSGLSLFPRRFWNILSSQTTAAAVLNKLLLLLLLLARVHHEIFHSPLVSLPRSRSFEIPNFFVTKPITIS